jgi:plasmid stabilization system protein ParE
MRLEFHPEAELELSEAAARYEAEVVGLGRRFAAEVQHLTELLIEHPLLGTPIDGELRGFALRRFPYNLVDSAAAEVLTVLAVANQHRRPGYWRNRLSP